MGFASIHMAARSLNEADKSLPSAAQVLTSWVISLSVIFPAGDNTAVRFYLLSGIDYF